MTAKVSFDLDGTLIGCAGPTEPLGIVGRILGAERLRLGTRRLFHELKGRGWTISVYTTSLRSHWNVRKTFWSHGLRLDRIVNGDDHDGIASMDGVSKKPDLFGFRVHVDDAPISKTGTLMTKLILVDSMDNGWVEVVLKEIGAPNKAL